MGNIRLFLRANEKLYINGAVIRFDRKTSIELLNDVSFLLEGHVIQPEEATTPLRQLYFVVQMMLIDPNETEAPLQLFQSMLDSLLETVTDGELQAGLEETDAEMRSGETFKALKSIRKLFDIESRIMEHGGAVARTRMTDGMLALQQGG